MRLLGDDSVAAHDSNKHVRSGFIEKFSERRSLVPRPTGHGAEAFGPFLWNPVGFHRCNILQTAILFPKLSCTWLADYSRCRWTDKSYYVTTWLSVPPLCYSTKQMSNLPLVLQREFDSMRIASPPPNFACFLPPHMLGCGLFPFRAWLTWVR